MDEQDRPIDVFEWNNATSDFRRYHDLFTAVDELITIVRVPPIQAQNLQFLYSYLRTIFNNLQSAFLPLKRAELRAKLIEIKVEVNELIKACSKNKNVSCPDTLIEKFEYVHEQIIFAKDQAGLGAPRRPYQSKKEKMDNAV